MRLTEFRYPNFKHYWGIECAIENCPFEVQLHYDMELGNDLAIKELFTLKASR